MADAAFTAEFGQMLREYAGVPSPLYDATRAERAGRGADPAQARGPQPHRRAQDPQRARAGTAHPRMGKTRMIAETGAGQHGVATATAAAYLGLDCTVYMGEVDTAAPGAQRRPDAAARRRGGAGVSGSRTLKDAINEAIRDWVASVDHTAYCFGTAAGPHPFPAMVRDFCRGIGDEARAQCLELTGELPDLVAACVGGGSNAIGLFTAFLDDPERRHLRVRGRGRRRGDPAPRRDDLGRRGRGAPRRPHLRPPGRGRPDRRVALDLRRARLPRRRAAARPPGRDRPGDVPARSPTPRRWTRCPCSSRTEGIIPAIESAHALAGAVTLAKERPGQTMLVNLSGRGDKDMGTAIEWFGLGQA